MYKNKVEFLFNFHSFSNFEYLAGELKAAASEKVDEVQNAASEVAADAAQKVEGKYGRF
jgi:hypothetical protein